MHFIFSESVPCEAGCESAISPTIYVVKHFSKLKLKISEQSVDICVVRKKKTASHNNHVDDTYEDMNEP